MANDSRNKRRLKRHLRIRKDLSGTPEKPRLCVFRSNKNISAQIIYVLIESTYGDRLHKDDAATREEFRSVILTALKDRGKVLIPSFVVDRAQIGRAHV